MDEILKNNCRHNSMTHVLEIFKSSKEALKYINEIINVLSEDLKLFYNLKEQCLNIVREKI